jgi:TPR repeat protein
MELTHLRQLAEQGDAQAQYDLGVKYAKGQGVPQDFEEASWWFHQAAKRGVTDTTPQENIDFEIAYAQALVSREDVEEEIRNYEKQFGMSSTAFLELMKRNDAPDSFETMHWWSLLDAYKECFAR